jgi:hypothetical protein
MEVDSRNGKPFLCLSQPSTWGVDGKGRAEDDFRHAKNASIYEQMAMQLAVCRVSKKHRSTPDASVLAVANQVRRQVSKTAGMSVPQTLL